MPIVKCKTCNKDFYVKPSHQKIGWGKYCSIICRSKSQMKGKKFSCNVCGKQIYRSPKQIIHSKSRLYFCSKKCQTFWRNRFFVGEKHINWINGEYSYREILKRAHIDKVCKLCGIDNKLILNVHHIDHNRQNNHISNLIWLCFNCHFLVHHDHRSEKSLQKLLIQG